MSKLRAVGAFIPEPPPEGYAYTEKYVAFRDILGFSTLSVVADFRSGGRFSVVFGPMNGDEHNPTGIYREVLPEKKLVFTWNLPAASEPESLVTFRLKPLEGGTELTLTRARLSDEAARASHQHGWNGLLDKLPIFLGAD